MTPLAKFNSIVVTTTTIIMYLLWLGIEKILNLIENSGGNLAEIGDIWKVLTIMLTAMTSLGFYRLVTKGVKVLFEKSRVVKRYILGDEYLEGTWVGFFVGNKGHIRYLYETYEQSLEGILVSGHSYREDRTIHGNWKASNPVINRNKKRITYYYETDMIDNSFINPGLASFDMEKCNKKKFYNRMQGYSSDLYNPNKLLAIEEKVSDDILTDITSILDKAEEVYSKNKSLLPKKV